MTRMTRMTLGEWLAYIERQHPRSIEMGLKRVRQVAASLGLGRQDPGSVAMGLEPGRQVSASLGSGGRVRRGAPAGGTNGKGSTVTFIVSIAREDGWGVGGYSSPHLLA